MIKPTAKFSYLAPIARLNPPEPPFRVDFRPIGCGLVLTTARLRSA